MGEKMGQPTTDRCGPARRKSSLLRPATAGMTALASMLLGVIVQAPPAAAEHGSCSLASVGVVCINAVQPSITNRRYVESVRIEKTGASRDVWNCNYTASRLSVKYPNAPEMTYAPRNSRPGECSIGWAYITYPSWPPRTVPSGTRFCAQFFVGGVPDGVRVCETVW